jgi:hypothetical protein
LQLHLTSGREIYRQILTANIKVVTHCIFFSVIKISTLEYSSGRLFTSVKTLIGEKDKSHNGAGNSYTTETSKNTRQRLEQAIRIQRNRRKTPGNDWSGQFIYNVNVEKNTAMIGAGNSYTTEPSKNPRERLEQAIHIQRNSRQNPFNDWRRQFLYNGTVEKPPAKIGAGNSYTTEPSTKARQRLEQAFHIQGNRRNHPATIGAGN